MNKSKQCDFCFQTFIVKNNKGLEQRFCKDRCRNEFHSYGRKYVSMLIDKRIINFSKIKKQVDEHLSN